MYRKIEDFIKDWQMESEATVKVFENIKDEVLSKKENENIRSMATLVWHISTTPVEMLGKAGLEIKGPDEHSKPPATVTEIVSAYKEASASVISEISSKWNDASLEEEVKMYGDNWKKGKILSVLILHQTHHRGQLTILLREAGLKVHGVYGPSKEDWALWNMPAMD